MLKGGILEQMKSTEVTIESYRKLTVEDLRDFLNFLSVSIKTNRYRECIK